MKKDSVIAVVFFGGAHGFNHINSRLGLASNEDIENVRTGDLPFTYYNDAYSNVGYNIQYNIEGGEGYGGKPCIHNVYNMDIEEAERTIKVLRKVHKAYVKDGAPSKNIPALIKFFKGAKVKRVFIRYENSNEFVNMSLDDAIYALTKKDIEYEKGTI